MSERALPLAGPDLALGVSVAQIADSVPLLGHAGGQAALLVRQGERIFAVGADCGHWHLPLEGGLVVGETLRCPFHHACFSLLDGAVRGGPAMDPLPSFEVIREGDRVRLGRQQFVASAAPPTGAPVSVVIVGAGAAGAVCAQTLRLEGYAGDITLFGDEVPVDRPNLSKDYLTGKASAEWIPLRPPAYYEQHRIVLNTRQRVSAIEPRARRVSLSDGRTLAYGALVLATGAAPAKVPFQGADLPHVTVLRTHADADRLLTLARHGSRAVIVGAGFIGLEVAASLRIRGLEVTVVAPEPTPMQASLGEEVGRYVRSVHEARGVRFRMGVRPERVTAAEVELSDGSRVAADLVVVGVGVQPNAELAERAGLTVNGGIVVDEWLRTSAADVFAAGDVARYPCHGDMVRLEHWVVAMRQGRAVARTIAGRGAPYRDVPFFWSQHFDVVISLVGHVEGWDAADVHGRLAEGNATVAYRRGGRILAVATVGRDRTSLQMEAAMERGDHAALEELVSRQE